MPRPILRRLEDAPAVDCPCGQARRILTGLDNDKVSVHIVHISKDSQTHYHRTLTETYYVLEGEGVIELDDVCEPLRPGTVVHIPPGTRHRARGELVLLNIVTPPFDPNDEHLVESVE